MNLYLSCSTVMDNELLLLFDSVLSYKWYSCTYNPTYARGKYIDLDFIVSNIFGELDDSVVMKGDRGKECEEKKYSGGGETRENFEGQNYEWERKQERCERDKELEKKRMCLVYLSLFLIFLLMINY